jgi:outer membrane protein assembly factor BamB
VAIGLTCAALLVAWVSTDNSPPIGPRVPLAGELLPLTDMVPPGEGFVPANGAGDLARFEAEHTPLSGSWPQLGGPTRQGVGDGGARLARRWPASGPRRLWEVEVGEGYAGAAVHAGRVYVLDHDQEAQQDVLRSFSLASGQELWRYSYSVPLKRNHGLSRTVPAVTDRHVVTLGPKGHVTCLDATTGELRWALDLVRQYGTRIPDWYAAQCPLIDRDRVILAPAGDDVLMMAVDLETGKPIWTTPNPGKLEMTHASITTVTLRGHRLFLYSGMRAIVGVSAESGEVVWEDTSLESVMARIAMPVAMGDDRVLLCGGYGVGCVIAEVHEINGRLVSKPLKTLPASVLGAELHTPIYYQEHVYGVRPGGELVCLDRDGKVAWTSGNGYRFFKGYGGLLVDDGVLLVVDPGSASQPAGTLTMVELTPRAFVPLARATVVDGQDAWGPLALAGGRLLVRDLTHLACLDMRATP